MARTTIKGLPGTRRPRPRHETTAATDLVERLFSRDALDRLWVGDITRHRTYEGMVCCAVLQPRSVGRFESDRGAGHRRAQHGHRQPRTPVR